MTREEILKNASSVAELPAPAELNFRGKIFHVARISGAMRDAMATHKINLGKLGQESFREADLAAMGWCQPDGTPMFEDLSEGVAVLSTWDGSLQEALAAKFVEVNNLNGEAAEKNSDASQS